MIEINLLSEELRPKVRNKKTASGFDAKKLIYLVPLFFVLLILLHFSLAVLILIKSSQLHTFEKKWQNLEPQRKAVEVFNNEYNANAKDANLIKQLTEQRIIWSEKLSSLTLDLPSGIWFSEISASPKGLIIRCSVVSPEKIEVTLIKNYIDALKNDTVFYKDFSAIELGSLQSRAIGGMDVTDFSLTGALKAK